MKKSTQLYRKQSFLTRTICVGLSMVFSFTQVVFAQSPEKNFWEQRRQTVQQTKAAAKTSRETGSQTLLAQLTNATALQRDIVGKGLSQLSSSALTAQSSTLKKLGVKEATPELASLVAQLSANGVVREIRPGKEESPFLIYIQDVHGHKKAQQNIASMILKVLENNPNAAVGLEGGAEGPIPLGPLRSPSVAANKEVGHFFFNTGYISGAELAAFAAPQEPHYFGLENKNLYLKNVAAVRQALPLKTKWLAQIERWNIPVEQKKQESYSFALKELDQKVQSHEQGKIGLGEYLTYLTSPTKANDTVAYPNVSRFLQSWQMETRLDFQSVEKERNRFLARLVKKLPEKYLQDLLKKSVAFRMGQIQYATYYSQLKETASKGSINLTDYPQFEKYIQYVLLADSIKPESLFEEIAQLEETVWESRLENSQQRKIYELSKDLALTEKLVRLILTPQDWAEYASRQQAIQDLPERISSLFPSPFYERANVVSAGPGEGKMTLNTSHLLPFETFYEMALARDQALADNFISSLSSASKSEGKDVKTAILVAGGFHSQGLNKRLAGQGTLITVAPKLDKVDPKQGSDYLSVFTRGKMPLDKLFESPKITLKSMINIVEERTDGSKSSVTKIVANLEDTTREALGEIDFDGVISDGETFVYKTVNGYAVVYAPNTQEIPQWVVAKRGNPIQQGPAEEGSFAIFKDQQIEDNLSFSDVTAPLRATMEKGRRIIPVLLGGVGLAFSSVVLAMGALAPLVVTAGMIVIGGALEVGLARKWRWAEKTTDALTTVVLAGFMERPEILTGKDRLAWVERHEDARENRQKLLKAARRAVARERLVLRRAKHAAEWVSGLPVPEVLKPVAMAAAKGIGVIGIGVGYMTNVLTHDWNNLVDLGVRTKVLSEETAFSILGRAPVRATTGPAGKLNPVFGLRKYEHVSDSDSGTKRVVRPGDLYKRFGQPVGINPSAFVASTIKLFRDIRKRGELERNVANFQGMIQKTIAFLKDKSRTDEEDKVLAYFKMMEHVLNTTGLKGTPAEQVEQARQWEESKQSQIQLKTEKQVKNYLLASPQKELITYFMPHFSGIGNQAFQAAIGDMAKAQGFYGENAALAAYYRAFQLLVGITFPVDPPGKIYPPMQGPALPVEESLKIGLTFLRSLYQARATEELKAEQDYLSDTGPENYAANLIRILADQNPLLEQAITGIGDLDKFVNENKDRLISLLASEPYVGKTPAETRINIAGIPVDFFETGRPSGFTPLTLVAALDGQIIQKVGNEKTREFVWEIKDQGKVVTEEDIPAFLATGAADLDWVVDMFEGMADRDIEDLTPVEQLYKAGGMALKVAKENHSPEAYALTRMLVASDYILKAEETVKARQKAIVHQSVMTRGGFQETSFTPQVYVAPLPEVYQVLAEATQSQLNFLKKNFGSLPASTPNDVRERITQDLKKLEDLQEIFNKLYHETKSYQGGKVEQLVPIQGKILTDKILDEWVKNGNLSNAKPVMFPAMDIGVNDKDIDFTYQGQVMFFVGAGLPARAQTIDGKEVPFALYHLGRMIKTGGETVTTAEHTQLINNPDNAAAYETDEGMKELYGAEQVDTYDPLKKLKQPVAGDSDSVSAHASWGSSFHDVKMNGMSFKQNDYDYLTVYVQPDGTVISGFYEQRGRSAPTGLFTVFFQQGDTPKFYELAKRAVNRSNVIVNNDGLAFSHSEMNFDVKGSFIEEKHPGEHGTADLVQRIEILTQPRDVVDVNGNPLTIPIDSLLATSFDETKNKLVREAFLPSLEIIEIDLKKEFGEALEFLDAAIQNGSSKIKKYTMSGYTPAVTYIYENKIIARKRHGIPTIFMGNIKDDKLHFHDYSGKLITIDKKGVVSVIEGEHDFAYFGQEDPFKAPSPTDTMSPLSGSQSTPYDVDVGLDIDSILNSKSPPTTEPQRDEKIIGAIESLQELLLILKDPQRKEDLSKVNLQEMRASFDLIFETFEASGKDWTEWTQEDVGLNTLEWIDSLKIIELNNKPLLEDFFKQTGKGSLFKAPWWKRGVAGAETPFFYWLGEFLAPLLGGFNPFGLLFWWAHPLMALTPIGNKQWKNPVTWTLTGLKIIIGLLGMVSGLEAYICPAVLVLTFVHYFLNNLDLILARPLKDFESHVDPGAPKLQKLIQQVQPERREVLTQLLQNMGPLRVGLFKEERNLHSSLVRQVELYRRKLLTRKLSAQTEQILTQKTSWLGGLVRRQHFARFGRILKRLGVDQETAMDLAGVMAKQMGLRAPPSSMIKGYLRARPVRPAQWWKKKSFKPTFGRRDKKAKVHKNLISTINLPSMIDETEAWSISAKNVARMIARPEEKGVVQAITVRVLETDQKDGESDTDFENRIKEERIQRLLSYGLTRSHLEKIPFVVVKTNQLLTRSAVLKQAIITLGLKQGLSVEKVMNSYSLNFYSATLEGLNVNDLLKDLILLFTGSRAVRMLDTIDNERVLGTYA